MELSGGLNVLIFVTCLDNNACLSSPLNNEIV